VGSTPTRGIKGVLSNSIQTEGTIMASKFSKRHYIDVAEILKNRLDDEKSSAVETEAGINAVYDVVLSFADFFGHENPRFNRNHFIDVVEGRKALNSRP
jgi:hypothetical protein